MMLQVIREYIESALERLTELDTQSATDVLQKAIAVLDDYDDSSDDELEEYAS